MQVPDLTLLFGKSVQNHVQVPPRVPRVGEFLSGVEPAVGLAPESVLGVAITFPECFSWLDTQRLGDLIGGKIVTEDAEG